MLLSAVRVQHALRHVLEWAGMHKQELLDNWHDMGEHVINVAHSIYADRYKDAVAIFAAGSIVRGEEHRSLTWTSSWCTPGFRVRTESRSGGGYPVEAFVHDPATLEHFFLEIDRPSGVPALPQMIVEGIEIPGPSEMSRELKRRAAAVIEAGPPPLDSESERRMRFCLRSPGRLASTKVPRGVDRRRRALVRTAGGLFDGYRADAPPA
jgi:hypothetical protein